MKNIFYMIILFFSVNTLVASEKEKEYFISTNVISPFSQMNKGNTIVNVLTPLFSNVLSILLDFNLDLFFLHL